MSFDARHVLIPISDYIRHFFSCRECAANFGSRVGDLATRQLEPRDVVLWLWKMHNKANSKLHGDASEDPLHPKVQFPSYEACPSCRVTAAIGIRYNVSDNQWHEDRVLTYLLRYYGKEHIYDDDVEGFSTAERPQGGKTGESGFLRVARVGSMACAWRENLWLYLALSACSLVWLLLSCT